MKFLVIYFSALTAAVFGLLCQSCSDGHEEYFPSLYSSDEGGYSSLGTVVSSDELLVESDSYGLLYPINAEIFTDSGVDTVGQRVLMEINFIDEIILNETQVQTVLVKQLYKVLTKAVDDLRTDTVTTSTEIEDLFGNQPIWVTSASISGFYLNIQFNVKGHNTDIAHRISLLLTDESTLDSGGLLRVELRHNPEGDTQEDILWGVVSFSLSSIPEFSDPDFKGFRIIYNTGEGDTEEYVVTCPQ